MPTINTANPCFDREINFKVVVMPTINFAVKFQDYFLRICDNSNQLFFKNQSNQKYYTAKKPFEVQPEVLSEVRGIKQQTRLALS